MSAFRQLCSFQVGDHLFGLDIARVQEILLPPPLTRVPGAPPEVAGLLNLRGQIVPAIDLRRRLDLPEGTAPADAPHVVLRGDEGAVSLRVDAIGDILPFEQSDLEPLPDNLRGPLRSLLLGVHALPDRLLLVLSADAVVDGLAPASSASASPSFPVLPQESR
ncbi:chemotaxis protein CheW [Corallococcus aberystwythensis]|uniref:Purine-binding chemotaxis protein CheW n=1 Tax=Corallococcus aberystwythensis TaxID=2316722 RepID=A0A3A8Q5A9_9BACT|nr:chemotaxis protein CheW [Corallococcus aberystwythensis]RKH62681.1 purine-binding chemotaxis protein CheW [Corallococcus aberystwythensis]